MIHSGGGRFVCDLDLHIIYILAIREEIIVCVNLLRNKKHIPPKVHFHLAVKKVSRAVKPHFETAFFSS